MSARYSEPIGSYFAADIVSTGIEITVEFPKGLRKLSLYIQYLHGTNSPKGIARRKTFARLFRGLRLQHVSLASLTNAANGK